MRRKVRGTVSGIYMYSAALSVENAVTTPRAARLCNKTGFRVLPNGRNSSQSAFNNISGIYASARALRAL